MPEMWRERLQAFWQNRSPQEKKFLLGYAVVLIVALLWPEEEYFAPDAAADLPTTEGRRGAPKHWEIRNLQATAEGVELRDPFAYAHPTASEKKAAGANSLPSLPAPLPKAVATVPESLPPSPEKTAAAGAVYTLKGIAGDGGKRLALTHDGEKTVTVGVGEKVGEYTVVEIGEDYLRMTKEGEIKELRLGDGSENR